MYITSIAVADGVLIPIGGWSRNLFYNDSGLDLQPEYHL